MASSFCFRYFYTLLTRYAIKASAVMKGVVFMKTRKFWIYHVGGHRVFITAKDIKEAYNKVREMAPTLEIIGYCEVE